MAFFAQSTMRKTEIALHFDVTRFRLEGITGHVFAEAHPDTVAALPMAASQKRLTLLHDHAECARPAQLGQRWSHLPRLQAPVPDSVPVYHWRNGPRRSLHDVADRRKVPPARVSVHRVSLVMSTKIPGRGRFRSTASTTPFATSTSTRFTRTLSSRSRHAIRLRTALFIARCDRRAPPR